jgi:hypothetical protein
MNVAIIGACVAGLSYTYQLYKNSITPTIAKDFKKKHELKKIVDTFNNDSFYKLTLQKFTIT